MNTVVVNEFSKLVKFIQEQLNDALLDNEKKEVNKHTFRLRQIKSITTKLKKYDQVITLENIKELEGISGFGKGSIKRVTEILNTGKLSELEGFVDTKSTRRNTLKELQEIIGVGRSNAIDFMDNHDVTSVKDLQKKYKKGEIELNDKILLGLKYHNVYQQNIPRKEIDESYKFMKRVVRKMNKKFGFDDTNKLQIQICGSYRREKPFSNDIDVLITRLGTKASDKKTEAIYMNKFVAKLKKERRQNDDKPFLIDDMTDKKSTCKYMGFCKYKDNPPRRIDIIFIPHESYNTALLYFTGSKDMCVEMRKKAKKLGYKLNENQLYDNNKKEVIKINSEKEVFQKLDMEFIEPKYR
jgi:DNA polymerase/3'-5' exonuclease PolX